MKIAVIIPSYNREKILYQTLNRIKTCKPLPDEIIIADQTKKIAKNIKKITKDLNKKTKTKLLILKKPNAQKARNEAAKKALSDILLFLDDDVIPSKKLFENHKKNYQSKNFEGVCGFYTEKAKCGTTKKNKVSIFLPLTKIEEIPPNYNKKIKSYLWPSCNGSILRETFLMAGGFDENYKYTLFDDTDLAVRLKKMQVRLIHDPACKVKHLKVPTGGKRPEQNDSQWSKEKWFTHLYFLITNFSFFSFFEILIRVRSQIINKNILFNQEKTLLSVQNFINGMKAAQDMIKKGRKLLT